MTTLLLSAVGCIIGMIVGFVLALARQSRHPTLIPARILSDLYVEIVRRVLFLITLMLFFFGAQVLGFDLAPLTIALISTSVISTAFVSEIIRGGLESLKPAQLEAAAVMNFTPLQTLRLVSIPQALPIVIPPIFGYFVLFIKDTALASQVGVLELTQAGKIMTTKGHSALLVYAVVLVLYFIVSYPLSRLGGYLENRFVLSRYS
ncbi:amino acid ABC transporter permease [Breoghania sp.]|uniref:amino acid ABC transporter permease n=1 Tax=Breoghania sp. TaxID=2065378 RepID=UPI0026273AF6|nr:amino acid ABC transporter permease [Breoghania sp.]MDJ0930666.1 amino acid ABC transporter permease [Breoghania sp.]